ncbi:hypothetical protein [Arthrobacter sp. NPDC056493]|uniref:hypothetical protein n=1 Tax=Arthrobacter sp. NPDC056493 TaxID=3345839 RepID=UPI00366AB589
MIAPTAERPDAATVVFNLPDYRVTETELLTFGQRRIRVNCRGRLPCVRGGLWSGAFPPVPVDP